MILPIVAFGDPVLRKVGRNVNPGEPGLNQLIDDMWETMQKARGVGLAAPQINQSIRLFVIDSTLMYDEGEEHKGIRQVFINAEILEEWGDEWAYEEGCLSIPGIRADVRRPAHLLIRYQDQHFNTYEKEFSGMTARVIQHEYDHIEGILFTDHLKPLKRTLLKGKLEDISKGKTSASYKMRFPKAG